ncbi:hypothetical protein A0H81_13006 [Grifola frondosa]|uniref:Uncharacterized protein n=1 Tax=Grifola frondosa TaxID=5627 RepID=A0A1C7LR94_GRIFR|nr:hypothetical protein A0H81_13006 [Grifola frondosa]
MASESYIKTSCLLGRLSPSFLASHHSDMITAPARRAWMREAQQNSPLIWPRSTNHTANDNRESCVPRILSLAVIPNVVCVQASNMLCSSGPVLCQEAPMYAWRTWINFTRGMQVHAELFACPRGRWGR